MKRDDERRFVEARQGDMFGVPFQCEYCWFGNLKKRDAVSSDPLDKLILGYAIRVNLDMMWSRERGTVNGWLSNIRKGRKMSEELGLAPVDLKIEAWPVCDNQGFQVAIETLRASQRPGRNDSSYTQFDTIRKLRTAYAIVNENTVGASGQHNLYKGEHGRMMVLSRNDTDSVLFRKFIQGVEKRMGRLVLQNIGISIDMLLLMLQGYEEELQEKALIDKQRKRRIIICGCAFVNLFVGALRGGEVLLMERTEFTSKIKSGKLHPTDPHVLIPLMGRFKGETGERNLLLPFASVTSSGIEVRLWNERLSKLLVEEGKDKEVGPAFCREDGTVSRSWDINGELTSALNRVQVLRPDLIPRQIDVEEKFNTYRSFRRGATTRVKVLKIPEDVIELNNRWNKLQNSGRGLSKLPMSQLYTEITQALPAKLRFSKSL